MNIRIRSLLLILLCMTVGAMMTAELLRAGPALNEVIIEGALAMPQGNQKAAFSSPGGFGADPGFDIGFRYRQSWPSGWALSPSFHYVKFGQYQGYADAQQENFKEGTALFRYGVDLQYYFNYHDPGPKFYLSSGAALVRNKLHRKYETTETFVDDGANGISLSAAAGLRLGEFEFSLAYHLNRFTTLRFRDAVKDYDWDYLTLRIAFALPRYDR